MERTSLEEENNQRCKKPVQIGKTKKRNNLD